nr:unnamed protein product [Naegleria fowleri]
MVGVVSTHSFSNQGYEFKCLYDGSKNDMHMDYVFYSYNRQSRILMAMGLGKAMIYVKFEKGYFDTTDDISNLKTNACTNGFSFNDVHYTFFNTSNSSLNSHDGGCVFLTLTIDRPYLISLLGNFEECKKQGLGKLIAQEYPCTDGCGMMRQDKFEQTLQHTNAQPFHSDMFIPYFSEDEVKRISAIQIRVHGFKGVLSKVPFSHWKALQKKFEFSDEISCLMRPSMKKYETQVVLYTFIDVLNASSAIEGSINRTFMSCILNLTSKKDEMRQFFKRNLEEYLNEKIHLDPSNPSDLKRNVFEFMHQLFIEKAHGKQIRSKISMCGLRN